MRVVFSTLLILIGARAWAFDIPTGLNESDRREIVRTLGLNSATKMLTNPYPLGGFSGFEFGISAEFVDIRDVRRLGCAPGTAGCRNTAYSDETSWRYSRLTIGKGLYDDFDIFINFMAPIGSVNVSDYGGALRWSAYQAKFLPINIALVAHFDQLNYRDAFTNQNIGGEAIVGVNVDNFALFFGGGMIQAAGTFVGGCSSTSPNNCTVDASVDPSKTVTDKITSTHTVVGLSLSYDDLFLAAEVDRYQDAVYSLKAGIRF